MNHDVRLEAGFTTEGMLWKRYLARAIDKVIIVFASSVLAVVGGFFWFRANLIAAILAAYAVVSLVYSVSMESSDEQATLGKQR